MGVLIRPRTGRRVTLAARTLVGRSVACTLSLRNPRVSGEHAAIFYDGDGWALRDLGSSNGTRLNGDPLGLGERRAIGLDDEVMFADEMWLLAHDGPPCACAVAGDLRLTADDGLLVLPDPDHPQAVVYLSPEGRWVLERGERCSAVVDGEQIYVDGALWTLELPAITGGGSTTFTLQDTDPHHFDMLRRLDVRLGRDAATIELRACFAADHIDIPHRPYGCLIAALARQNLADAHRPPAEQGWMHLDALGREAGLDQERMYVEFHRARRHFREVGIEGASPLFERRTHTRQIRLGVREVTVGPLDDRPG